jgi:hypothetical protein
MLRLARLRPLATAFAARGHFSRVYSTAATPSATDDALDAILQNIQSKGPSSQPLSTIGQWPTIGGESSTSLATTNEDSQLEAFNFKEYTDKMFGDTNYTTRSYDKFLEAYPALQHEVDTQKLHARLKYEQIYLKDHAHEPKTVFKFKNVVTKNYRTIARSWPVVRLDSFKYGHDHFLDEMYDDMDGKYLRHLPHHTSPHITTHHHTSPHNTHHTPHTTHHTPHTTHHTPHTTHHTPHTTDHRLQTTDHTTDHRPPPHHYLSQVHYQNRSTT